MKQKLSRADYKKLQKQKLAGNSQNFERELSKLVVNWANCETCLVRVLARILRIHPTKADVLFYAITSTRGRTELVERVGMMYLQNDRDIRHLQKLLRGFQSVTKMRNEVCHAEYGVRGGNVLTHVITTKYSRSDFDGTNYFEVHNIDPSV